MSITISTCSPDVLRLAAETGLNVLTVARFLTGWPKTRRGNRKLIVEAAVRLGLSHLLPVEVAE